LQLPQLPELPQLPLALPELPQVLPVIPNGAPQVVVQARQTAFAMSRVNDQFVVKHNDNGTAVCIRGNIVDGKAVVDGVQITRNGVTEKYAIDQVPEGFGPLVEKMIQHAAK
jgi:hypothetical protein